MLIIYVRDRLSDSFGELPGNTQQYIKILTIGTLNEQTDIFDVKCLLFLTDIQTYKQTNRYFLDIDKDIQTNQIDRYTHTEYRQMTNNQRNRQAFDR